MNSKDEHLEIRVVKDRLETRGKKVRPFEGMEPRKSPPKAWNSDKPPGGKLPAEAKPSKKS